MSKEAREAAKQAASREACPPDADDDSTSDADSVLDFFRNNTLYYALAIAWTAMLGSLYFSQVMAFLPCDLSWCWSVFLSWWPVSCFCSWCWSCPAP